MPGSEITSGDVSWCCTLMSVSPLVGFRAIPRRGKSRRNTRSENLHDPLSSTHAAWAETCHVYRRPKPLRGANYCLAVFCRAVPIVDVVPVISHALSLFESHR